jgi:phage FluMu protein Com
MDLRCKNCGHFWNYVGRMKINAICPDCKNIVKIGNGNGNGNGNGKNGKR